ncbi:diphthine synthase isoform b [Dacryopinax primogenitus]|uniref:diphthine methyl ester synthase n=1 Tax=Dacryopinax primogenitus (strain DJM 731) TaxID=1858805 RepID=M5FPB0_DACPD|nr:diphthine synthase isoform b [Dacryopinax primogenitus]EJT96938.1 diphthine synthase isoform b [Dacryopinax primogenitus]
MFYVIGLGLADEKDITVRGLEAVRSCRRLYLEAYTSMLLVPKEQLEAFYGTKLIVADRDMVETESDAILEGAKDVDVGFLVVGDPFGATTHTDLLLRARALGVPSRVIHNASIMNAIGACGLQLYNFGQAVSLVFFTENWKPDSYYDRIKENSELGLHTLVLLDIKVKEQSEENLARGRKIYEPPRYMSIPLAVDQLLYTETQRQQRVLSAKETLAIGMSRVGSSKQRIVAGTLEELQGAGDIFGPPLHSLVIVGKRLHPLEVDYAEESAINKAEWRRVAQQVYGCRLDE